MTRTVFFLAALSLTTMACSDPDCGGNGLKCAGPTPVVDSGRGNALLDEPTCTNGPTEAITCTAGSACRSSPLRCEKLDAGAAIETCGPIACERPCACADRETGVCDCRFTL